MAILSAFILIGALFVGRAVYVAAKIKKEPETTKYGQNPKTSVAVLVTLGAVLFFIGSIGMPIADFFRRTTYTFENKSSFTVTIMPEYGDDFQIQSGSVKSFESSHKNMRLNYSPATYIQSQEVTSKHWAFTNGGYYLEENRGFLIYPPESWDTTNYPGLKYKILVGQMENDFVPNINFAEENNPFSQFYTYIDVSISNLGDGARAVSYDRFNTANGLEGFKIVTNTANLLQIYYMFDTGQKAFIVTCSASLQSETDYNEIFDTTVKTLEFLY